ncbi:hypothetical protein ACH3XW_22130 [Acanthocheilonema viteae]
MVVSFLTAHNLTFSGSRSPAIHIVLSPNLLVFFNGSDIVSPFSDKRQLQDFLAIMSRKFPQLILTNAAGNNLMLQHEWKVLISTKSMMVYGLSLFNTILIILFIAACTVLFIGGVLRFFWLRGNALIRAKKHKQMYQCYIDSIKVLRMSEMETTRCNEQTLYQKYTKDAQNLYTFFGIHQQAVLPNSIFMMNVTETER